MLNPVVFEKANHIRGVSVEGDGDHGVLQAANVPVCTVLEDMGQKMKHTDQ